MICRLVRHKVRALVSSFQVFQFVFWAGVACYTPYIVIFLMQKNVGISQIGLILTLSALSGVLSQPVWGLISDHIKSIKKVFVLCLLITAVLAIILSFMSSTVVIAAMLVIITFFYAPLIPLLDSWTVRAALEDGKRSYGAVRLWGSIGFAILVTIMGRIVGGSSASLAFIGYGAISCLTVLISLAVKDVRVDSSVKANGDAEQERHNKRADIARLLKNYNYVVFLVFTFFLYISMLSIFSFLPKLMDYVGGNAGLYGIAMAVSAFSEVPILYFSSRLIKKYKATTLILLATVFYIIRLFIYSVAVSPILIILTQILQGLSYGLFLASYVYYIHSLAPEGLKTTAQTIGNAVYTGMGGIVGNYVCGRVIDRYGIHAVYRFGAIEDIVIFFLFLLSVVLGRKRTKRSGGFSENM